MKVTGSLAGMNEIESDPTKMEKHVAFISMVLDDAGF